MRNISVLLVLLKKHLKSTKDIDKIRFMWQYSNIFADVVQWQNSSFPSWLCGFDSHHLLHRNEHSVSGCFFLFYLSFFIESFRHLLSYFLFCKNTVLKKLEIYEDFPQFFLFVPIATKNCGFLSFSKCNTQNLSRVMFWL